MWQISEGKSWYEGDAVFLCLRMVPPLAAINSYAEPVSRIVFSQIMPSSCCCGLVTFFRCRKEIDALTLSRRNSGYAYNASLAFRHTAKMVKLKLDKISPSPDLVSNDTYKGIFDG
jgi:hypothetical protein